MKYKINEIQNRNALMEGRSTGMGFSILDKKSKYNFETLVPFTCCKDFLNDISFVENSGIYKNMCVYGFSYSKTNLFKNKKYFYLGINFLHGKTTTWRDKEEADITLNKNKNNLINTINKIETKLNSFKSRTTIYAKVGDTYIFKCPIFWMKYTFLISVYTSIIRLYFDFKSSAKYNSRYFIKRLLNHKTFILSDRYYRKEVCNFINIYNKKLIKDFKYPFNKKSTEVEIHNYGIKTWLESLKK